MEHLVLSKSSLPKFDNHSDKITICYAGNLGRFHDLDTFMKTAQYLKNEPDIVFLFVGEGYQKKTCQAFAQSQRLTNCQFHSYVAREELGTLLSCVDVGLVSLHTGHEGLSVPSKTYGLMAAGVPILGLLPKTSEISFSIFTIALFLRIYMFLLRI